MLTTDLREERKDYHHPVPRMGMAPSALLQGFEGLDGAEVHIVSCLQKPVIPAVEMASNMQFHGLHVPKMGWLRTGYSGCIRAVRKKLRELSPDIVHGQGTERDCAISAVFSGFPNVLTVHGNMRQIATLQRARPFTFYWLAARLERLTLPRTEGVVCISDYTRRNVAPLVKRTWLLPNAVDSSFFAIQPAARLGGSPEILYVGTICPWKNQNEFIRFMEPLAEKLRFNIRFLGQLEHGSPYSKEFLELVDRHPWCTYEKFADRASLRDRFAAASLLVLASLEDNCPMVILEAMAAGVPVLASSVGGIPELIENQKSGILCDPRDGDSIRSGVRAILTNPDLSSSLISGGRVRAERFHPRRIAMSHLEIYREVVGRGRSA